MLKRWRDIDKTRWDSVKEDINVYVMARATAERIHRLGTNEEKIKEQLADASLPG